MLLWQRFLSKCTRILSRAKGSPESGEFTVDWTTIHEWLWPSLLAEFKDKPGLQILEIGSYEGRSALWFLDNLATRSDSKIICVDFWENKDNEGRFDKNIAEHSGRDRVLKLKGESGAVLRSLPVERQFDFIYVDGSHNAKDVLSDAVFAWELLRDGGILLFDDYQWTKEGLEPTEMPALAIDAFLAVYAGRLKVLHTGYQVAVRKTCASRK